MRSILALAVTTALAAGAGSDSIAQQKTQQSAARTPATQYWMDVATHSMAGMPAGGIGMAGMGAPNHFGATRGAAPGKYLDLSLWVRGRPAGVQGTHAIPPGMALGPSLPLVPDRGGQSPGAAGREERPRGRLLVYWGCDANVRPGQPRVVDMRTASPAAVGAAFSGKYAPARGARSGPGHAIWPNQQESRSVPAQASLVGEHRISGDGVPASLAFPVGAGHDFMPAVEVSANGALAGAIAMEWRPLAAATGYFAHATGSKGDDMIIWSSSEQPDAGYGLLDFVPSASVERWVRERVLLSNATTRCTVPAGIFAGADGAIGRLMAYGPELARSHPPGAQAPEWMLRLRVMSTGMTLLGEEAGSRRRGGGGGGGSGSDGNPLNTILRGIFR